MGHSPINIRYGKLFHFPRQIAKYLISFLYPAVIRIWPLPKVHTIEETIEKVSAEGLSIARFGDSEMLYIVDHLNLPYQRYNARLGGILKQILAFDQDRLLVGLPEAYRSFGKAERKHQVFWRSQISWTYPRIRKYLNLEKKYFNANITRFYYGFGDLEASKRYFLMMKHIWQDRQLLIIEGEKSRLGVGNDLFANAVGVERILGPAHHAFDMFDELLEAAEKHDRRKLVLVAMGPTAKALAYELTRRGFQVIDIGNLDIEYEWFRMGVAERVKVKGKYTSEVAGGRVVDDVDDPLYLKQIICRLV